MRNVIAGMAVLVPGAATACESCRPSVRAAIFGADFYPTLAAIAAAPVLMGLAAAAWMLAEKGFRRG